MTRGTAVRALLAERWYPTLLGTRLASQTADGIFQASLAGAVIFNPEHHTSATEVVVGFVVLLLPYSLIGPFAGVFLDRWRRQRVLTYGAAVRAVLVLTAAASLADHGPSGAVFAGTALAALAINRFYLAALSAALPSVVPSHRLVLANALSPTAGTVATIAGGGIGLACRALGGSGDHGDASAAVAAAVGYGLAALVATRMPRDSLGPHARGTQALREQLAGVGRGLLDGSRHLARRPLAWHAIAVIVAQRVVFGVWSIMALLLYRNTFHDHGVLRSGLVGVGQAVTFAGIGLVLAAFVTPSVTEHIGRRRWIVVVTAGVAVTQLAFGAPFAIAPILVSSLALGFATQATKVCVDTLVQIGIDDDYRGRVFSLYDTANNLSFIAGTFIGALVLPDGGKSLAALVAMSVAYVAIALVYQAGEPRLAPAGAVP